MERGKSKGFANSIGDSTAARAATVTDGGSTKAIEVTRERSEGGQQEMVQPIVAVMRCPHSMRFSGAAGFFCR